MRNLVIMPAMANNRERMNLGEYAEEATIIMGISTNRVQTCTLTHLIDTSHILLQLTLHQQGHETSQGIRPTYRCPCP